jgi:hypothetical protein
VEFALKIALSLAFICFPRPLPRIAEIIRPGAFVSFVYVSTPADVIYASEGDPEKCLFYIEKFLTIKEKGDD